MKKLRKLLCIITVITLHLAALSGCGSAKAPTAESLLRDMKENLSSQTSCAGSLQGTMEFGTSVEGLTLNIPMDLSLNYEALFDPSQVHVDGTIGMSFLDISMDIPLEAYTEDATVDLFVMDKWMKSSLEQGGALNAARLDLPDTLAETAVLQPETEEILGKTAYRIDLSVAWDDLLASEAETEGVRWGDTPVEITLWIDAETVLPIRETVVCSDLEAEDVQVKTLEFRLDYTDFNTVESIAVPPEAYEAQEAESLVDALL